MLDYLLQTSLPSTKISGPVTTTAFDNFITNLENQKEFVIRTDGGGLPGGAAPQLAAIEAEIARAKSLMPALADGGFVNRPTVALIGEAGPEVVTPLRDFERMMGISGGGKTINYYAAPNESIDKEEALFKAMRRAKVVAAW